jgi:hypothetical protein
VPVVDILDPTGALLWDAPGRLAATLFYPRDLQMRTEYAARWRAANKSLLPAGQRLTDKGTHRPAKIFGARPRIGAELKARRDGIEHVGTALWLHPVLAEQWSKHATQTQSQYALTKYKDYKSGLSRAALKRHSREYKGVIHLCAAFAHQTRMFGKHMP